MEKFRYDPLIKINTEGIAYNVFKDFLYDVCLFGLNSNVLPLLHKGERGGREREGEKERE